MIDHRVLFVKVCACTTISMVGTGFCSAVRNPTDLSGIQGLLALAEQQHETILPGIGIRNTCFMKDHDTTIPDDYPDCNNIYFQSDITGNLTIDIAALTHEETFIDMQGFHLKGDVILASNEALSEENTKHLIFQNGTIDGKIGAKGSTTPFLGSFNYTLSYLKLHFFNIHISNGVDLENDEEDKTRILNINNVSVESNNAYISSITLATHDFDDFILPLGQTSCTNCSLNSINIANSTVNYLEISSNSIHELLTGSLNATCYSRCERNKIFINNSDVGNMLFKSNNQVSMKHYKHLENKLNYNKVTMNDSSAGPLTFFLQSRYDQGAIQILSNTSTADNTNIGTITMQSSFYHPDSSTGNSINIKNSSIVFGNIWTTKINAATLSIGNSALFGWYDLGSYAETTTITNSFAHAYPYNFNQENSFAEWGCCTHDNTDNGKYETIFYGDGNNVQALVKNIETGQISSAKFLIVPGNMQYADQAFYWMNNKNVLMTFGIPSGAVDAHLCCLYTPGDDGGIGSFIPITVTQRPQNLLSQVMLPKKAEVAPTQEVSGTSSLAWYVKPKADGSGWDEAKQYLAITNVIEGGINIIGVFNVDTQGLPQQITLQQVGYMGWLAFSFGALSYLTWQPTSSQTSSGALLEGNKSYPLVLIGVDNRWSRIFAIPADPTDSTEQTSVVEFDGSSFCRNPVIFATPKYLCIAGLFYDQTTGSLTDQKLRRYKVTAPSKDHVVFDLFDEINLPLADYGRIWKIRSCNTQGAAQPYSDSPLFVTFLRPIGTLYFANIDMATKNINSYSFSVQGANLGLDGIPQCPSLPSGFGYDIAGLLGTTSHSELWQFLCPTGSTGFDCAGVQVPLAL